MKTTVLILFIAAAAANAQDADGKLPFSASSAFAELTSEIRYGFTALKISFDVTVKNDHLVMKEGTSSKDGSWWGIWEAGNSTGSITTFAAVPEALDKTKNRFWVRFNAATETPIPAAILTHLLATARATEISSGDTMTIKFPYDEAGRCMSAYSITVRMNTGALVSTSLETTCGVTPATP